MVFAATGLVVAAHKNQGPSWRLPIVAGVLLVAALAWQLIPLPFSAWSTMPGRGIVADLDRALGFGQISRASSMSPAGTWNTLFSLLVPAAAMILFSLLIRSERLALIPLLLSIGTVSALMGLTQIAVGGRSALYTYAVTNAGSPVGLFANGNHQAVFLASFMPLLAVWSVAGPAASRNGRMVASTCLWLVFAGIIYLTGSRAGIALGLIGALLAVVVLVREILAAQSSAVRESRGRLLIAGMVGLAVVILATAVMCTAGHCSAGVMVPNAGEEMRFRAMPTMLEAAKAFWPFGSGPGSFASVYQIFEPRELVGPHYLNHAHNDWLEVVIENGLLGVAMIMTVVGIIGWLCVCVMRVSVLDWSVRLALCFPPLAMAAASFLDYPLRTPLMAAVAAVWLLFMLDIPRFAHSAAHQRLRR
ncbi:O-antigen ligase family protein [Qipengyuania sp. YIM B01966]|uniref:O-antigen ligase family protein n=1 Tax=Qipengyuania sp. YIM B01966 TaxID=2778646 RepID=UPI0018F4E43B